MHFFFSFYFFFFFFYSSCSHLEQRTSVKCFVLLQFLKLRHPVGLLGRRIGSLQGRYLTQTQNIRTQTSMPRLGFEPTIPVFERSKTVHVLDREAIVTGIVFLMLFKIVFLFSVGLINNSVRLSD
jgi:hypothetical protein